MMSNELNIDKIGNQLNLAWDDKRVIKERKNPLVVLFGKTNQKANNGFLSKRSDKQLQNGFKQRHSIKFG